MQSRSRLTDGKNNCIDTERGTGGMNWEIEMDISDPMYKIHILLHFIHRTKSVYFIHGIRCVHLNLMPNNAKECSNYRTIGLISHASKVMLKILQARLQQYVNRELPDVQASFRKGRGTRDQIANIRWIMEKAREFQKNIYFWFIDYAKAVDCWITINGGKFFKRWDYQTTLPAS